MNSFLCCNMIFVILVKRSFHALPRRLIGLDNAGVFLSCTSFQRYKSASTYLFEFCKALRLAPELPTFYALLHYILEFSIIRINEVNTTQFSSIAELQFFDSPLWLFFAFRRFRHLSESLATKNVVWRSFAFLSVSSRTMHIHRVVFIQYGEPCETCPCI